MSTVSADVYDALETISCNLCNADNLAQLMWRYLDAAPDVRASDWAAQCAAYAHDAPMYDSLMSSVVAELHAAQGQLADVLANTYRVYPE